MSAATQYAYLSARVSVLAEHLFWSEQLDELIEHPLEELDPLFKMVGLGELIGNCPSDPDELEQRLMNTMVQESLVLLRPLHGIARDLLLCWVRRYELINLKSILRRRLLGLDGSKGEQGLLDLGALTNLAPMALIHIEDIAELLRSLEKTRYAEMGRLARVAYQEKRDPIDIETMLDRQYFVDLERQIRRFPVDEKHTLWLFFGTLFDHVNLVWLLRYRLHYRLPPAHVFLLLAPAGRHLTGERLQRLVQMEHLQEVVRNLPEELSSKLAHAETIGELENLLERELRDQAQFLLRRTVFNLARVFAFLLLREMQVRAIHGVVKGKQLALKQRLIRMAAGTAFSHVARA